MKRLNLFIILIFTCHFTAAQTKLCILGTIHVEKEKIKNEDYLKAFNKFKPDIILYEADTILDLRSGLKGPDISIEFNAIHEYIKSKPKTLIFPYDWTGKQNFLSKHNFWVKVDSLGKVFNSYFSTGQADKLSITTFEALSDFRSAENELDNESLETLNKPYVRKLVELKSKWEYRKISDLASSNESLKKLMPILQLVQDYWDIRNK